ncbi:SRPBCC domain-containing protein [Methylocystis sp. B8]|nr:SRPBCC domain-containing protein [Methylocystis sp. B8]
MVQRHIETEIEIEAPAACVWGILTDFNHMPSWNPFITGISGNLAQGETLSLRIAPPGKPAMRFNPVVLALSPNSELRWLGRVFVKGLLDGEHYFLLEPLDEKRTRLRHGEIFSGLLAGMLSGMLPATQQGFEAMNSALKAQAEMRQKS